MKGAIRTNVWVVMGSLLREEGECVNGVGGE